MSSAFMTRIAESADRLSEIDQKIVDALLERRDEMVFLSGPQFAEKIEVHGAAPTRLAQKLGYKGFPALRSALQKEMLSEQDAAVRMKRSVRSTEEGNYLSDLIASEIAALNNLEELIPQAEINQVADKINSARNVYIFAQGHALSISHFFSRRLERFGKTSVVLSGRGRDVAERLVGMTRDDVVIMLAFRKQPAAYAAVMRHVQQIGAVSILVSDLAGLIMSPEADITLAAPRGRSGNEFQTPVVPTIIVSGILLTMAARHEEVTIGALEKLSKLFADFDKT